MHITPLSISEILLITPTLHRDERGVFAETYSRLRLAPAGLIAPFVQDNHCVSEARGVVRGLHFQAPPHAQGKLVRVTRGSIFDVAVDIRLGSPTYGRHVSAVLSAANWQQLWIPVGFAHGYCTLEPDTEVIYKVTDIYAPACERSLKWDDPGLCIAWPVTAEAAIVSAKDKQAPPLRLVGNEFEYWAGRLEHHNVRQRAVTS